MPTNYPSLAGLAAITTPPRDAVPMDDVDVRLLQLLSQDARMSQRQLAAQLGVSPPTVGERLSRLERLGVVRGYSVTVDWEGLGFGVLVYLSVTVVPGHSIADVMRDIWDITEVEEVVVVTGRLDLLVRVRVRDHKHLRQLLIDELWQVPGLQGTETMTGMAEMPPKAFLRDVLSKMLSTDTVANRAEVPSAGR